MELLGNGLDKIKDPPQINLTQVNICNSMEWLVVGDILARILGDYPDLRVEVAQELFALRDGRN